jgi:hypothetical protein
MEKGRGTRSSAPPSSRMNCDRTRCHGQRSDGRPSRLAQAAREPCSRSGTAQDEAARHSGVARHDRQDPTCSPAVLPAPCCELAAHAPLYNLTAILAAVKAPRLLPVAGPITGGCGRDRRTGPGSNAVLSGGDMLKEDRLQRSRRCETSHGRTARSAASAARSNSASSQALAPRRPETTSRCQRM